MTSDQREIRRRLTVQMTLVKAPVILLEPHDQNLLEHP